MVIRKRGIDVTELAGREAEAGEDARVILIMRLAEQRVCLNVLTIAGQPIACAIEFVVCRLAVARLAGRLVFVLGFAAIDFLFHRRVKIG